MTQTEMMNIVDVVGHPTSEQKRTATYRNTVKKKNGQTFHLRIKTLSRLNSSAHSKRFFLKFKNCSKVIILKVIGSDEGISNKGITYAAPYAHFLFKSEKCSMKNLHLSAGRLNIFLDSVKLHSMVVPRNFASVRAQKLTVELHVDNLKVDK